MTDTKYQMESDSDEATTLIRTLQHAHSEESGDESWKRIGLRLSHFISEMKSNRALQWTRTDLKRKSGDIFKELEMSGPQLIANVKEQDKERAVLLLESEMKSLLRALTELSKSRYATGADLFRDLAHDDAASEIALTPRKKIFQNRRSVSKALSAGR